ncbi:Fe-S-containing protein [Bifidobacterium sp. ESL0732]|uniref:Fe-S-containing protein n=1 Tax=Bifidobacterium sp. ESL0732 TaxID=2983222 RepID=UPI0023F6800E|nr:Fe-S-containing protein [Bifidobacterium sp. ESL0732]WEV64119.1 Fe-S-containing protein [Bifidobacterium sp. ESL0732]
MLEEFVGALPGMVAPALLVMTLSVLLGVGEGRDRPISRQWRLYGLLVGIGAALVFTVLRVLVIVDRRSGVNLPVLIGCVVCDVLILAIMACSKGLVRDWHEHPIRLHVANAISAIGIALTTFFASQDVFMQLTSFVETGESPFTSKMLLRALGFALGIATAVVVAAIFRTMRTTAVRGSFLAASMLMLLILLARHVTQLCSLLMSMMFVEFDGTAFNVLILAANNDMKLVIASVLVFIIPVIASIAAGFRTPLAGDNDAVVREHKAFRRRAKAAGVWSLIAMIVVTFALTAGVAKVHEQPTLSPPEGYSQHNGIATIAFNKVDDGHLHRFQYKAKDGTVMRFIIIKKNGGSFGVGLDACLTCGDAGYYEKDGKIICKRCEVEMNVATIGFKGGCNPIPFPYEASHGKITIHTSDLDALSSHFKE